MSKGPPEIKKPEPEFQFRGGERMIYQNGPLKVTIEVDFAFVSDPNILVAKIVGVESCE